MLKIFDPKNVFPTLLEFVHTGIAQNYFLYQNNDLGKIQSKKAVFRLICHVRTNITVYE